MNVTRYPLAAILAVAITGAGAPSAFAAEPDGPQDVISRADAIYISVLDRIEGKNKKSLGLDKADEKELTEYYSSRSQPLVWVDENGMNDRVRQLRTTFARAGEWGLNPSDYVPADSKDLSSHVGYPAAWLAEAELKTSIAAYTYARHAQTGRFEPTAVHEYFDKRRVRPDVATVLTGLTAAPDKIPAFLESFHPQHEQFVQLKQLLAQTRSGAIEEAPAKPSVNLPDGPSLGPRTSHPHIAILRERLNVPAGHNAPDGANPEEYYDDRLAEAVRAFQKARGLTAKGVVNAATRTALNKPVPSANKPATVTTIIANMERWRWEPRDLGGRHIRVNVPEFMFRVMDRGKVIHEERIVAGSKKHMTPIFNDEMETIVLNPYWHVPESIKTKEMLPALSRDPSFLDRNRLEVVWQGARPKRSSINFWGEEEGDDVDWSSVDPSKVSLRQTPGTGNALGTVKFLFPNKHSVYMHDTPTKHLFNNSVRAYSHGCMRVRNPLKLAEVLLADQGWNMTRINSTLKTAHDEQVTLTRKVPIHIQYFTLWVDSDGKLQQFGDVYGHDARVKAALRLEKAPEPERDETNAEAAREHGMAN